MKLKFLGVGSAFTSTDYYQSNLLLTAANGKKLLIDCGSDIRFSMAEAQISPVELDAVYISHQHADHIGGMEYFAFATFFNPENNRPKLFIKDTLAEEIWESSLKGGLRIIDDSPRNLHDFFEVHLQTEGTPFMWEGLQLTLYKMPHVITKLDSLYSYGLLIEELGGESIFFSSDATYCPKVLQDLDPKVVMIFHDCETSDMPTGVHCHYNEITQLPAHLKAKTWLYHYQPDPPYDPLQDGFLGFAHKGQEFIF